MLFRSRKWQPTPVFLPGESQGRGSLVAAVYGVAQSRTRLKRLHFHFSLSCFGEGDGNPLQCSCLENPRDGGAWWLLSMGSHRVGHDRSDLAAGPREINFAEPGCEPLRQFGEGCRIVRFFRQKVPDGELRSSNLFCAHMKSKKQGCV